MPIINIPKPLREKLGEEATDSLVELLKEFEKYVRDDVIELVEERFAKRLAEEMGKLRSEIYNEMGKLRAEVSEKIESLRTEMYNEIGKLRAEMHDEIGKLRGDIIKWMFIFWIGQFIALVGLIFTLVRFLK